MCCFCWLTHTHTHMQEVLTVNFWENLGTRLAKVTQLPLRLPFPFILSLFVLDNMPKLFIIFFLTHFHHIFLVLSLSRSINLHHRNFYPVGIIFMFCPVQTVSIYISWWLSDWLVPVPTILWCLNGISFSFLQFKTTHPKHTVFSSI